MTTEEPLRLVDDESVPTPQPATQVFEHWVETTWTGKGPRPRLTTKRRALINKALKDYDTQDLIDAIDGIMTSDFHMGNNNRGRKYLDIGLILRDAEHIERFATMKYEEGNDPW